MDTAAIYACFCFVVLGCVFGFFFGVFYFLFFNFFAIVGKSCTGQSVFVEGGSQVRQAVDILELYSVHEDLFFVVANRNYFILIIAGFHSICSNYQSVTKILEFFYITC